ncbi:MAG: amidohydrolase [Pirellulaceae bacterium]
MRFRIHGIAVLLLVSCVTFNSSVAQQTADLILRGGKVVTVDEQFPGGEAIAVAGDKILAVGTDDDLLMFADDDTEFIELNGRLVIPGFIEGHGHFVGLGQAKMMLDLTKAESWDDIVDQVADAARITPPGEWIIGRGWHQEKWSQRPEPNVEGYPVHDQISAVSPNHPVLLTHASGHMCFANDYAMRMSEIDADTKPPSGGEILHAEDGRPIGVFRETAQGLIRRAQSRDESEMTAEDRQRLALRAVELATQECLENGITSFQDAGSSFATIDRFTQLADEGKLRVRMWVMVRDHLSLMEDNLPRVQKIRHGENFLTVNAIKLSLDGALGAHGAWLLMPYSDMPNSEGLNTAPIETAEELAKLAVKNGYQYCIHAIGDQANRKVLDIFEKTFNDNPSIQPRRWRIEHAQHLHPDDIPRFGELGVIASMQGIHCTSDAIYVLQRLGPRRSEEGAYVWQKLMQSGGVVTNGTDAPVEDIDPIASFYATVTRKLKDGTAFYPDQCMSREEALESYTMSCAYAAFEEDIKGSLTPGKLADIVVLSHDIMTCPEEEIQDARVDYTIVGGKVAWDRAKAEAERDE